MHLMNEVDSRKVCKTSTQLSAHFRAPLLFIQC
jgi:hypothetical protein